MVSSDELEKRTEEEKDEDNESLFSSNDKEDDDNDQKSKSNIEKEDKSLSEEEEKVKEAAQKDDDDKSLFSDDSNDDEDKSLESGGEKNRSKGRRLLRGGKKKGSIDGEDTRFIDSDDDLSDVKKSYDKQREYNSDDDPFGDEDNYAVEEETGFVEPAEGTDFDNVLKNLKTRNKRKSDGMTDEQRDEFVQLLLEKMDKAYEADLECQRKKKPCINKLKMLNEVMETLSKGSFQTILLERNLLLVLGQWLRPSTVDGSLCDLTIRNKIYKLLFNFHIESDHLRRAQFGKVISYLKDSKKETPSNRVLLAKLIRKWARMVFGKTDNFRMLEQMQSVNDETTTPIGLPKKRNRPSSTPSKPKDLFAKDGDLNANNLYRAQIPKQQDFQFTRRVMENTNFQSSVKPKSPKKGKTNGLHQRLKNKKRQKAA